MLNNIIKHAKASDVKLELKRSNDRISLKITDNGVGFRVDQQRKGIGIYNIISRTELYNGEVDIVSSPGKGCSIGISFPITDNIKR